MNINYTSYRMPDDYDPHRGLDTMRGLADAIARYFTEGPGIDNTLDSNEISGVVALVERLAAETRDFHAWFRDIENRTTLELPRSEADFERLHVRHARKNDGVREPTALYLVS